MRIDMLDVGKTKYGDCLLVRHDQRSILIDGAHPGDTVSIRAQLASLLQHPPPFAVDLLVVTHCHLDHIGCLPALSPAAISPRRSRWWPTRSWAGAGTRTVVARSMRSLRPERACCSRRCRR